MAKMRWKYRYVLTTFGGAYKPDEGDDFLVEMKKTVARIRSLFKDFKRCEFIVVTIPADMAVREAERMIAELNKHGITIKQLVVNNVVPLNELNETIPAPFGDIAQRCLRVDPRQRCTASQILSKFQVQEPPAAKPVEESISEKRPRRWIVVPITVALLFLVALIGSKYIFQKPTIPPAENHPAESQTPPADVPAAQSPAPFAEKAKPTRKAGARGSVLQQVLPDVSRQAQSTITGRVKVGVRVAVDASGNVSQAKLASAVTSKYFANLALGAARRWKFNPPQVNGQAATSEWLLRFQFGRTSTQVFASEINR